jgi:hypothetical protein
MSSASASFWYVLLRFGEARWWYLYYALPTYISIIILWISIIYPLGTSRLSTRGRSMSIVDDISIVDHYLLLTYFPIFSITIWSDASRTRAHVFFFFFFFLLLFSFFFLLLFSSSSSSLFLLLFFSSSFFFLL